MRKVPKLSIKDQWFLFRKFPGDPIGTLKLLMEKYEGIFQMRKILDPRLPIIITQHPEHIQHVFQKNHRNYDKTEGQKKFLASQLGKSLLTTDGSYWKRQRKLIQPGFHRERLTSLVDIMLAETNQHAELLDACQGTTVNLASHMMKLTFKVIYKTVFSDSIPNDELDDFSSRMDSLHHYLIAQMRKPYMIPLMRINGTKRKMDQIKKDQDDRLFEIIRGRRKENRSYSDLLDMLLNSRYEDTGQGMTDQQLRDELTTIYVAGHETSANALTWAFYLLAQNQHVVDLMLEEYSRVLGSRDPSAADLPKLVYTRQVINEAMRLFPPAWIVDRCARDTDVFGDYEVPKGAVVLMFLYGSHRHKEFWKNPETFDPNRFEPALQKERHRFAFSPFGGGPRLCIGQGFAMMEMQVILCQLLRKFRFEIDQAPPELEPLVTLRPKGGIKVKVFTREESLNLAV
jgi:cytochrome P450